MPDLLPGVTILVGSGQWDARPGPQAVDTAVPFVMWKFAEPYVQRRFSLRVENAETGGFAFITSGPRFTGERFCQFSDTLQLNTNFNGLCRVRVAFSQQTTGEFEHVSEWHYFVYDTGLERFSRADGISVSFQGGVNPDGLPTTSEVRYQLQLSVDPLFTDVRYDNATIEPTTGSFVQHDIPSGDFNPIEDATYFYRVRQFDGMDYGPWSITHAFISYTDRAPALTIDGIEPTGNDSGDVLVHFTVADLDQDFVSVELLYLGGNANGIRQPLMMLGPTLLMSPGSHTAVWRTLPQFGYNKNYNDIVIYGRAHDGKRAGEEVFFGPISLSTDYIQEPPGGVGSTEVRYPVNSGYIAQIITTEYDHEAYAPAEGKILTNKLTIPRTHVPVRMGPYAHANMYSLGPLENFSGVHGYHMGFGHGDYDPNRGITPVHKPHIISQDSDDGGRSWTDVSYDTDGSYETFISVDNKAWLFSAPFDPRNPDTLPLRFPTRFMLLNPFLKGYIDLRGVEHDYPDNYNWDKRPDWHIGREIWGENDAWIQVAWWEFTDHPACPTCRGRSWVASADGPPYRRVPCPNPDCLEGRDMTQWYDTGKHSRAFNRSRWYRLNRFLHMRPFLPFDRYGLPIFSRDAYARQTQYVWGRHRSSLDPRDGDGETADVLIEAGGYTRRLPHTTDIVWPAPNEVTQMVRDDKGGVDVVGWAKIRVTVEAGDVSTLAPVQGSMVKEQNLISLFEPVQGFIGEGKRGFWMGGADPDTSIVHAARSYQPSQPGSIHVKGNISRQIEFLPFQIRFFQSFWDAFNTIHWQYNPSESTQAHLQYAARETNGTFVNWKDVKPTNAKFNSSLNAWLIDPFTFHAYWNTYSHTLFEDGKEYTLRIRLFSPNGNVVVPFIFSPVFRILRNVSNPVSVLSTEYEPFSKLVTIKLRTDDTQHDQYNLTRFWYSIDDGQTWIDLPRGEVYGELSYLSSDPTNNQNIHTIWWNTASLSLTPGDKFRIRVESMPSDTLTTATLPFFKWYAPNNPYLDDAKAALAELLGRVERWRYDEETKKWKPNVPPVYNPGLLAMYQQEHQRIKLHPSRDPGPSGMYIFVGPSGNVIDQQGYTEWLAQNYGGQESHGQAMNRVATQIDQIVRVQIPAAQQETSYRENEIRRNLIEQGFYAEEHFLGDMPNVREVVNIQPVSNVSGESMPSQVERWWKFEVQKAAEGGERLTDNDGNFAPREITPLEQVYFKWQMDRLESFDSQPFDQPLREIITNERGERLSVSIFYGGFVDDTPNPGIDDPNDGRPTNEEEDETEEDRTIAVGGVLKVRPTDLPGQHTEDQMIAGQSEWDGLYYWRVAAYNALVGPAKFRPRPRVDLVSINPDGSGRVNFVLRGHRRITNCHAMFNPNNGATYGHWISRRPLETPLWMDVTKIRFVSDRRAQATEPSRNNISWTPPGTNRLHPCMFYDEEKQQYVLFYTKNGFTQDRIGDQWVNNRFRPCSSRMMDLPDACEYSNYFENAADQVFIRPCVLKHQDTYWMFMTAIPAAGQAGRIMVSTSTDAHNWSVPSDVGGIQPGINPTVVYHAGQFHMWYERRPASKTVIYYATSGNGYDWTMVGSGPAFEDAVDATCPSVVRTSTGWMMAFNSGQTISSIVSTNGTVWTGKKTEFDVTDVAILDWWDVHSCQPSNPWLFYDNYLGNQTLRIAFNYTQLDDPTMTMISFARWEDREWESLNSWYTFDYTVDTTSMNCTPVGTPGAFSFSPWWEPFMPGEDIRFRLQFEQRQLQIEYHRQSAWVDRDNMVEVGGNLEPPTYTYNSQIVSFPYMLVPEQP